MPKKAPPPVKVSKTKAIKVGAAPSPRAGVAPAAVTPSPTAALDVTIVNWKKDEPIHRVHLDLYKGNQFNPGKGNARFSPIKDAKGNSIPTLYGGNTFDCAAMESVFHDVPFAPGTKIYDKHKLDGQNYSVLASTADLSLADLSSKALRRLGIKRNELIDTEKDRYPDTRLWAEAIHTQYPDVQGLSWVSRQDDQSRAIVLFGDRIDPALLVQKNATRSLMGDASLYNKLLDLASQIGVDIV
jgi:hypothetical protein